MTTETVDQEIVRVLREELLIGSDRPIPLDAPLGELGVGLDSLGLLKAVLAIEDAFGVQLPNDILSQSGLLTAGRLAELVAGAAHTPSADVDASLRDSTVPPRHHRMERLAHDLSSRGYLGPVVWAAARLAWPAKLFLFARSRHVVLERPLENSSTNVKAPPGIELRRYGHADEERFDGLWPEFMKRSSQRLVTRLLNDGAVALVATEGERILALDLLTADGASGEIALAPARGACWGLYLVEAPDARGRGIGLALIGYSLEVSRELGYRAQLAAVRDDNKPMLAAGVQLLGFRVIGHARRTRILGFTWWRWLIDGTEGHGRRLRV